MQLRVTVKRLNKRRFIPWQIPEPTGIVGQVDEGFTFEGVEVSQAVIPNPAIGKWYKDRDGYFYWGGGVTVAEEFRDVSSLAFVEEEEEVERALQFDPLKMSWGHKFYDIPFIWNDLKTRGSGVLVAIIDTGIDTAHEDLIANIHPMSRSFVSDPRDIQDMDIKGHGTRMAGIVVGSGKNKVFGIAPDATVLVLKATLKKVGANVHSFIDAIKFVTDIPEVDIVSISYTLEDNPLFKQAIHECLAAKKIIVGAIGNFRNTDLITDPDTFPSSYNSGKNNVNGNEVIAVGAFNIQNKVSSFSNCNDHLSFLSPGETVLTAAKDNGTTPDDGTSIATAFTAGCLALMISYCKMNNKPGLSCAKAVLNTCDDIGPEIGHDPKSGFGFLNLRNAISKIK